MSYLLWRISQPNLLIGGRGPAAILGLLGHGLRHLALLPAGVDGIQQPLGWVASPGMFDALALNEGARLLQRSPRVTMADHVPEQRDGKHKGSMARWRPTALVFDAANSSKSLQDGLAHGPGHPHQDRANLVMMPKAHRFSRSSYCASRRLYVAQRMRGGLGGKSYASSVVPPHLSCGRLAILRARVEAR
jgi:hypothetical protein